MNNPIKNIQELQSTTCTELLMTSVPPPKETQIISINGPFECKIPLRTRNISWPQDTSALCHHCAGPCNRGPPLPAVRYYDSQNQLYWIYGPFCCSSCVYGHICENYNSKQLSATHTVLREYFGITSVSAGPPRSAHQRFGGPLNDHEFYTFGETKQIVDELEPPFVTFAHYMIAMNGSKPVENTYDLLPQSAGQLSNLSRPKERKHPLATKTSTGQAPLLLNFIATLQEQNREVPKKRKAEEETHTAVGYLSRYVKK